MVEGGFEDCFEDDDDWKNDDDDDDDDDDEPEATNTTQPLLPSAASTPYHRGEEIECKRGIARRADCLTLLMREPLCLAK